MLVTRNKQYILSFKKWIHKSELFFFSRWNTYSCLFIIQSYSMYNIHMYLPAISSCINAKWGLSRLYSSLRKIGAEIPFTFHPLALGLFFWKLSSFFLCYGCQHQFARLRSTLLESDPKINCTILIRHVNCLILLVGVALNIMSSFWVLCWEAFLK